MKELGYFVYQIYPKSFNDTTGNGIGDINGIIEKLPYISDLGFDYIWLTPIYISPQKDNGYDVEDYYRIDPLFGSEADFDNLIIEAQKYNIKIMMDMVFNHTSTEHKWFKEALKGNSKYKSYYIWSKNPTTWESKFGGSAWKYVDKFDQYYLHLFDETQADLNWENPDVRQEIYQIVNYWIKRGVKGFRFDVINLISKNYPLVDGIADGRNEYTDGKRVHEFLKELRANTFAKNSDILTVGEMSSTSIDQCVKYANSNRNELDSVFHFHHLKVDYQNGYKWSTDYFDLDLLKTILKDWQLNMQKQNVVDTLFWSCHDQPRIASRFNTASTRQEQLRKNKTLAMMMYLMRGISYIYQGEEIGMENYFYDSINDAIDIEAINYFQMNQNETRKQRLKALSQKSRDNARTPMQWNDNGGFTEGKPWIKMNSNYQVINAENQINDHNSTYNFYKELIKLKKNNEVLIKGTISFEDHKSLIVYTRSLKGKSYKIIVNLLLEAVIYQGNYQEVIINNGCKFENENIKIPALGSCLIEI